MPSWSLENAQEIAEQSPYTFYKPSAEIIARISPGEVVKLIFTFTSEDPEAPGAERMWVIVDEIRPDGTFRGRLDNEPRYINDLELGEEIIFAERHIINTEHDEADNLVQRYLPRCFITRRILDDGCPVAYLYREPPEDDNDSGWRLTANDESDDYMNNPDNIAYVSLGAALSCDDSYLGLLDAPYGSAFVFNAARGEFETADFPEGE